MPTKKRASAKTPGKSAAKSRSTSKTAGKVGSDPKAAADFAAANDFGVPETGHEREREYVSREIKANDPGASVDRSDSDGNRTAGVGGNSSGVGSSSGGDIDTDLVTLGAVAQSGPDDRTDGPDMIGGDQSASDAFASPKR